MDNHEDEPKQCHNALSTNRFSADWSLLDALAKKPINRHIAPENDEL
jgi:hypothetical protein